MHVPEAVVIPCVVVIRFFPTIAEDYRQIRNAMALRGISSGGWGIVRHPTQSLEYILIPLLMKIRMTVIDWLVMIVVTVPLALDITGVM